jgi:hypothetical protein
MEKSQHTKHQKNTKRQGLIFGILAMCLQIELEHLKKILKIEMKKSLS